MPHRILKASSARPAQKPLVGCADDASSLTPNTVALRHGVCNFYRFSGPTSLRRERLVVQTSRFACGLPM